ncbi:MAG: hypothetical protein CVV02_05000 [Firmicutes bacterium HGW-Firmicutes-7]|nr:MAG: hypothetical protein CVV02_05000 [Firmicutes bacterium HGW-Firmicutes-7]
MRKIKILAIAPYAGLRDLINDISQERDDVEIHSYISDMHDGLMLAKELEHKGYDVILSRAGTAELIRKESKLPVIDINLSLLDMMRSIKLAQNYSGKFAIVGYNTITKIAKQICELLQYDIEIKTINNMEEIEKTLLALKDGGIGLIVGDVITNTHAKKMGLNTILITTGKESIINAFDEAKIFFKSLEKVALKNTVIKTLLENSGSSIICFDEQDAIIYSNLKEDITNLNNIISDLKYLKGTLIKNTEIKILKKYKDTSFLVKGILSVFDDEKFLTYYIYNQTNSIKPFEDAIRFSSAEDYPQINIDTFNSSNITFQNIIENAKTYARLKSPIIIIGERGTGKDTIAYTIYQNGLNSKNPLIIIDSKYISEKKWLEFFESEHSLFLNSNFTIYIKNIHLLDEGSQKIFESYLINTNFYKRNKLIFSMASGYSENFDNSSFLYFIKNRINALPLLVPTLNQRREDIPNLVSLYLNELNPSYNKQVIGLENDAITLLQDFDWTENIDQLKRVIRELIILTDSSYIKYETVEKVLKDETPSSPILKFYDIDLNKTLEEISNDIIKIVLKEENYNTTKAAKRLGISRSTLWRKIN